MIQGEMARRAGGDKEIFSFTSLKIPTQNLPKSSKIEHGFFAFSALPISGLFWKNRSNITKQKINLRIVKKWQTKQANIMLI